MTSPPRPEGRSLGAGAEGGGRGSPLPRVRCRGSLGWAREPAPTRAVARLWLRQAARRGEAGGGVARREGQGGEGAPSGSRLQVSQPRDQRPGGRREMRVPPSPRPHASISPPFMCPSVHSSDSHSFNIYASDCSAFRAHLLCARRAPGSFAEPQCRSGSQLHLSPLPHLADEDDGTGGSPG